MMRHRMPVEDTLAGRLNLTPLIDMVFILLIFFMVTSTFTKESGVDVSRPAAQSAVTQERAGIFVSVTAEGAIWIDRREVELMAVRAHVERLRVEAPEGSVLLVADKSAPTGLTIQVLDQIRLAGVTHVAVAADPL